MVIILLILGLCFGSFVNALVWRLHEQSTNNRKTAKKQLSILNGRSICPICKHKLAAKDLIPIISWLSLKGRCRYCHKPISKQYPLIELLVALLFVISYLAWPSSLTSNSWQAVNFITWLVVLVGLVALAIYDIKWMILPDRIIYPLLVFVVISVALQMALGRPAIDLLKIALSAIIGGGLFEIFYLISKGKWIGGGDIKLGILLGIMLAAPELAILLLFLSSVLGDVMGDTTTDQQEAWSRQ